MKILRVHNFYQQPGGEDQTLKMESSLLRQRGHEVIEYTADNDQVESMSKLRLAVNTVWSREHYRKLGETLRAAQPQIAHFHNTFMLISPAAYYACQRAGVPVVQHLHNYRMFCPSAVLYRDGHVCEDCMGKLFAYPGIVHKCYRENRGASAVTAVMQTTHKLIGTWHKQVDVYIAMTEFVKNKFVEAGWDERKIIVKQHFIDPDPGMRPADMPAGKYILFVGRLTIEKGVMTMLKAWQALPEIPLKIVGDGPMMDQMQAFAKTHNLTQVEFLGHQDSKQVHGLMREARALLFPSEWYETFGRVAVESFACGVPVITTSIGAQGSIVDDGRTGWHFKAGDAADMAAKVQHAFAPHIDVLEMGKVARQVFETQYTADANYQLLMNIYDRVLSQPRS